MSQNGNRVYLGDLLDEKKYIDPYQVAMLIVGCGSGKTTLIKNWYEEGRKILYITSRAIKRKQDMSSYPEWGRQLSICGNVSEFRKMMEEDRGIYVDDEPYTDTQGRINRPGCYLPIQVAGMMEKDLPMIDPDPVLCEVTGLDYYDYIWNAYDYIIVDECHFLMLDSTYMQATAKIWFMLKQFVKVCNDPNKHIIFMTATAECIVDFIKTELNAKVWDDFTGKTYSVKPTKVRFTHRKLLNDEFKTHLANEEKFVYFTNEKTKPLDTLLWILAKIDVNTDEDDIDSNKIDGSNGAYLHKNEEVYNNVKNNYPVEYKNDQATIKSIIEKAMLPVDIKFAVMSPGFREAININNTDIKHVYIDSHLPCEIVQYAGRFRKADFDVTIVDCGRQFTYNIIKERAIQNKERKELKKLNKMLLEAKTESDKKALVKKVETKELKTGDNPDYHPYIVYNPYSFKFEFNTLKAKAIEYAQGRINYWNNLDRTSKTSFSSYIRPFFKGVKIEAYITPELECKRYWLQHKHEIGKIYTQEQIDKILERFTWYWYCVENLMHSINWYMKKFCQYRYNKIYQGKHKGQYKLEEWKA